MAKKDNMFKKRAETTGFDILNAGKQVDDNLIDNPISEDIKKNKNIEEILPVEVIPNDRVVKDKEVSRTHEDNNIADENPSKSITEDEGNLSGDNVSEEVKPQNDTKVETITRVEVNPVIKTENNNEIRGNFFIIEKENKEMKKISAYVRKNIWDEIGLISERTGINKTQILNKALEFALDNLVVEE